MARARTIVGFAVAPLATLIAVTMIFLLGWALQLGWFRGQPFPVVTANIGTYLFFSIPLAYLAALVLGVPAFLFATRRRIPAVGETAILGALLGSIPALFTLPVANWQSVWWILLASTSGLFTSVAFWWIALRHRRNAPNSALQPTPTRAA
jgi:hypothetical protein